MGIGHKVFVKAGWVSQILIIVIAWQNIHSTNWQSVLAGMFGFAFVLCVGLFEEEK